MAPAGNKSLRLSRASHVKYKYLPTYLRNSRLKLGKLLSLIGHIVNKQDSFQYFDFDIQGAAFFQTPGNTGHGLSIDSPGPIPRLMKMSLLFACALMALHSRETHNITLKNLALFRPKLCTGRLNILHQIYTKFR